MIGAPVKSSQLEWLFATSDAFRLLPRIILSLPLFIAYVPEFRIYGLETYLTENDKVFCYEYTTQTMGNGKLGIVKNDIEVTDSIARELSMQTSVFKSYNEFIESVGNIPKLFDRVIIDYQL